MVQKLTGQRTRLWNRIKSEKERKKKTLKVIVKQIIFFQEKDWSPNRNGETSWVDA